MIEDPIFLIVLFSIILVGSLVLTIDLSTKKIAKKGENRKEDNDFTPLKLDLPQTKPEVTPTCKEKVATMNEPVKEAPDVVIMEDELDDSVIADTIPDNPFWKYWPADSLTKPEQQNSIKKGLAILSPFIKLDRESQSAYVKGSSTKNEKWYHVTLSSCECRDFIINKKRQYPCKHIYCLANALGMLTPPDHFKTESEKKQSVNFEAAKNYSFHFGGWPDKIHSDPEQIKRRKNGEKLRDRIVDYNQETGEMLMSGAYGEAFHVTLNSCNCVDFHNRRLPCQHMYCLADMLGLLSDDEPLPESSSKNSTAKKQATKKSTVASSGAAKEKVKKESNVTKNTSQTSKRSYPVVSDNIRFGLWPTKTHLQPGQAERMKRGHELRNQIIAIDPPKQAAYIMGDSGTPHHVTLRTCDCQDFLTRRLPCAHIYCLADALQLLPTKKQTSTSNIKNNQAYIRFGCWPKKCHTTVDQIERMKRGKKLKSQIVTLDAESQSACIRGENKLNYYVTLNSCTCSDFYIRHLPCEHIYCLADQLGLLKPTTQNKEAKRV